MIRAIFFLVVWLAAVCTVVSGIQRSEEAAAINGCSDALPQETYDFLQDFYDSTQGLNWIYPSGATEWVFPSSLDAPCKEGWDGIVCYPIPGVSSGCNLFKLQLSSHNLNGTLPQSFTALSALFSMTLADNLLRGEVPPSFGSMPSLFSVDFSGNNLQGTLPTQFGFLTSLGEFYFTSNQLSGAIPTELGLLPALATIGFNDNLLSSTFPSQILNMSTIKYIYLDGNMVTGTIPPLGSTAIPSIIYIDFEHNFFTGSIPSNFFLAENFNNLNLQFNLLTGPLPNRIYVPPSHTPANSTIQYLLLGNNYLTNSIPCELGVMSNILEFYLNANVLSGSIPSELLTFSAVDSFLLFENILTGTIPPEIDRLKVMTNLELSVNYLSGSLPASLTNISSLQFLDLFQNKFTGCIPSSLPSLSNLKYISFYENSLSCELPSELSHMNQLIIFDVYKNHLTGTIPSNFNTNSLLETIFLNVNYLSGTIPLTLFEISSLANLDLYTNFLSGSIPDFKNVSNQLRYFELYGNLLTGHIPTSLGNQSTVIYIDLSSNCLVGTIPHSLGNIHSLFELILSDNSLVGTIPSELGRLRLLNNLQLGHNSLSGTLPSSLQHLRLLQFLNVTSNRLKGRCDQTFNASSQPRLVSIDLSSNGFTGSIPPAIFELRIIQSISLFSNCFSGSLPSQICSASSVRILIFDGLTSGRCENHDTAVSSKFMQTVFRGIHSSPSRLFGGSIPACIWQLPNLTTLHLSGNGITGHLHDLGNNNQLMDINLSNNMLTGSIPMSFQTSGRLNSIGLSSNKLGGILSNSFNISAENMILLDLSVNRLSGDIPPSFKDAVNINVLNGNLFQCTEESIPIHDPNSDIYVCGSSELNQSLLAWVSFFVAAIILVYAIKKIYPSIQTSTATSSANATSVDATKHSLCESWRDLFKIRSMVAEYIKNYPYLRRLGDTPMSPQHLETSKFLQIIFTTAQSAFYLSMLYTFICMLFFIIFKSTEPLNSLYSTHERQYMWITTSAFLHGVFPVVFIAVFVVIGIFIIRIQFSKLYKLELADRVHESVILSSIMQMHDHSSSFMSPLYSFSFSNHRPSLASHPVIGKNEVASHSLPPPPPPLPFDASLLTPNFSSLPSQLPDRGDGPNVHTNDDGNRTDGWSLNRVYKYFVLFILPWAAIELLNTIVTITVNAAYVSAILRGISESELLLLQVAIGSYKIIWNRAVLPYLVANVPYSSSSNKLIHLVFMGIFNYITGPLLATYFTDSSCLYYAIHGQDAVTSTFQEEQFNQQFCFIVKDTSSIFCLTYGTFVTLNTKLIPPWIYSFQCSSALLINYVPVLVFNFVITGVIIPLCDYILISLPQEIVNKYLPLVFRIWVIASLESNTNTASPLVSSEATVAKELPVGNAADIQVKIPVWSSPLVPSKKLLFWGPSIIISICIDISVLLTFGLASPLLSLIIVLKFITVGVLWRLSIDEFLSRNKKELSAASKELERATQGVVLGLRMSIGLVLCSSALFWSLVFFDMIGDLFGPINATITLVVTIVLLPLIYILFDRLLQKNNEYLDTVRTSTIELKQQSSSSLAVNSTF